MSVAGTVSASVSTSVYKSVRHPVVRARYDAAGMSRRTGRRLVQLYLGLLGYGVSMALLVRSDLGVMPWDVLSQGLSRHFGHSLGFWTFVVGGLVLLLWIPLRQAPGLGTVSNVVVISVAVDLALAILPVQHLWVGRGAFVVAGVVTNAFSTGLYVGARLGPGPRDGLMTGLVRRTGRSIRLVRSSIEITVVLAGIALGGTFGVGTILYAVSIGPLVQIFLPRLTVPVDGAGRRADAGCGVDTLAG
jgi:uncharacterized membrane protein YczE